MFLIVAVFWLQASLWNLALNGSQGTISVETGFSRSLLTPAIILEAVLLRFFPTILVRVRQNILKFCFFSGLLFWRGYFFSFHFSKFGYYFRHNTSRYNRYFGCFIILVLAIRAPKNLPHWNTNRSVILVNFNHVYLMISEKKD